jgi:hypothetical protein
LLFDFASTSIHSLIYQLCRWSPCFRRWAIGTSWERSELELTSPDGWAISMHLNSDTDWFVSGFFVPALARKPTTRLAVSMCSHWHRFFRFLTSPLICVTIGWSLLLVRSHSHSLLCWLAPTGKRVCCLFKLHSVDDVGLCICDPFV